MTGTITGTHPSLSGARTNRLLSGDFTPPRIPDLMLTQITIPAVGSTPARVVAISAPATQTNASVLTLGGKQQKKSIKQQIGEAFGKGKASVSDTAHQHRYKEIVEKWAVRQLPYHPEIIWSGTHFNGDLAEDTALPLTPVAPLPVQPLQGKLPQGTLHARLVIDLSSGNTPKGTVVDAIVTQPLLTPSGDKVLVPEGTHMHGAVVESQPARKFGHNGKLRFTFRGLDMPSAQHGEPLEIHGRRSAAETSPDQHITIDEEGQAKATSGPGKYAEPAFLGVLAVIATPDDSKDGGGFNGNGGSALTANGFGLIGRVISVSTGNRNISAGFAYYALSRSVYKRFIAKGYESTFPHDTEIQVTLSER